MNRKTRKRKEGLSIIEVLVASFVFGTTMLGSLGLMHWSTESNYYGRHITEATLLAQDKIEEFQSLDLDTLASGTDSIDIFDRNWTIQTLNSSAVLMDITVSWLTPDQVVREVTIDTIITTR